MSTDLKEIKRKILEEDQIATLLQAMGCDHIQKKNNRIEAKLPSRFHSNNTRSVQVKLTENLNSSIRSLAVNDIDIYGLVSYIIHDKTDKESQRQDLPFAKGWICRELGYQDFLNANYEEPKSVQALKWLKDVRQQRTRRRELPEIYNHVYDDDILNNYLMLPHKKLIIEDDIQVETQKFFEIGFDFKSRRIIFPIRNQAGEIVSIKGRTLDDLSDDQKYFYLIHFNKMIELYNWHNAINHIKAKKQIIIFESEKSCWRAWQYGYKNCVGLMGSDISEWQVNLIKSLGMEIEIIFAMDKDKTKEEVIKVASGFGRIRNVQMLFDEENLYSDKDSPLDLGKEIFEQLYKHNKQKIDLLQTTT